MRLTFSRLETRAEMASDGSGTFSEGDRIGLYIDNGREVQYRELTYQGGEWMPRLKRSDFGDGTLTMSAHYPAVADPEAIDPAAYAVQLPLDQSGEALSAADLLFSRVALAAGEYQASFRFEHAMHRLHVALIGADDGAEVAVRSVADGTVNLLTGQTQVVSEDIQWITPHLNSDGSMEAIILPQSATPYRDGAGLLRIANSETEVLYDAPKQTDEGLALATFEPGKQTSFRLSIKQPDPDVANRTLWIYGVNAPDFPGKENIPTYPMYTTQFLAGQWFRLDWAMAECQYLTWAEGCGWYDCNKSVRYNENDRNLCWAASASNLLIWWMVNNRPYIEAYTAKYGTSVESTITPGEVFHRPSDEFKPLYPNGTEGSSIVVNRAPVFEFFKSSFPDNGNWEVGGVNWFITGSTPPQMVAPTIKGFPGFFSEVFERTDAIAVESSRMPGAEKFSAFVIDALFNQKGLGFSVYDIAGVNTGNHAMVIWGAEFDKNGLVSHI